MSYILVDPSAKLNFSHQWDSVDNPWLAPGDTITSRLWTITPLNPGSPSSGPTLTSATSDIVFVEGLQAGRVYYLTEEVVTTSGLRDQRTIVIRAEHV